MLINLRNWNASPSSTFHSCDVSMVEFPSMNALLLNLIEKSELRFDEGADNTDCSTCQLPDLWCEGCVWLAATAISFEISVYMYKEKKTLE